MSGFSVKLPLVRDFEDGFALNKRFVEVAKQNLKHLILTNPGERIMDPEFGVGIRTFLFEQNTPSVRPEISRRIHKQCSRYLSYITIQEVQFEDSSAEMDINALSLAIFYNIDLIDLSDMLVINVDITS